MTTSIMQTRKLPLHDSHVRLGAKIGTFGEWEVPLYYTEGIIREHETVRNAAGVFDISHMGEFFVSGPNARKALDYLLCNKIDKLKVGKAIYSPLLNERGGFVDDVICYQLAEDSYLVIVNAANVSKDFDWFISHNPYKADIVNKSDDYGLLSLQGPASLAILKKIFPDNIENMPYYSILETKKPWPTWIARTGYTGELGYEILIENKFLAPLFDVLLKQGAKPIGFGARDTLRLEAKMLLYGQDMNEETTPLEADLEWTVDFSKSFIGKDAVVEQKKHGIAKKIVGFEMVDRGIARHEYPVLKNGKRIGVVTSGSSSPTLKKNIGLAYVEVGEAAVGNEIEIEIRGQAAKAKVAYTPFYKRNQKEM